MTDRDQTTAPEIVIDWIGGNCPVQAEGTINGTSFYFRARGESWSLEVGHGPDDMPAWEHAEWFGEWPDAGWMTVEQAQDFIRSAAARYAAGLPGGSLKDDEERMRSYMARMREKYGMPT